MLALENALLCIGWLWRPALPLLPWRRPNKKPPQALTQGGLLLSHVAPLHLLLCIL